MYSLPSSPFFALACTLLGAMTRALIGQEIQNGFVRGAAVGAISGAVFSLEIFAKRVEKRRGKRKEMSPKDAALAIQMSFRAYIIRRSQALRALRELAIFKTKQHKDAVYCYYTAAFPGIEVQVLSLSSESDFSSIISTSLQLGVLLGRPLSAARRRTFDMPDAVIQKELAAGVAQVVRILDESNAAETLEGCARVLPQEKEKRVENGSDAATLTSDGGVEKFVRRYGCRAMMLETVAAVPGIVEVQGVFFNAYFFTCILSPKLSHRILGYLKEEAIHSYTEFLKELGNGNIKNVLAPAIPLITGACLRTPLSEILPWLLRMMRLIIVMSTTLHLTFISRDNS
ncbi:hypothetical protein T459_04075 [Capsicum annuum]|uniref:Ubiquinol oxidase n=1 Tax=Capsicum annuum TaxID=4072 RepID=A0A2G3A406_CAPAN|nr:putative trehalose-phosphate phosphatase A-like isoform 1 [Capsicum annuum]PHT88962.1 hypothetical protein T459_04075 [Capsicum annuum]